uniref:Uncharacterized protein n=1 Tax=Eutreptiella gymnastica TaxID=73025 RepID=A0A7S1N5X2_9EUGL|mmetsp:Transcript_124221/g.215318  ORF Transcript_124221/g.215318 Transcript_124221/m.215318 type:complete len:163 (+) Transcript_124221:352-840(+)
MASTQDPPPPLTEQFQPHARCCRRTRCQLAHLTQLCPPGGQGACLQLPQKAQVQLQDAKGLQWPWVLRQGHQSTNNSELRTNADHQSTCPLCVLCVLFLSAHAMTAFSSAAMWDALAFNVYSCEAFATPVPIGPSGQLGVFHLSQAEEVRLKFGFVQFDVGS